MNDGAPDEEALRRVWPRSPIERARGRRSPDRARRRSAARPDRDAGVKEGGGGRPTPAAEQAIATGARQAEFDRVGM